MYNEIYSIWRREIKKSELVELPNNFYLKVCDYLKKLREETKMIDKKAIKARLMQIEEKNVRRMIREIVDVRRKKIVKTTVIGEKISLNFLASEEQDLYRLFSHFSENFQESLEQLFDGHPLTVGGEAKSKNIILRFLKEVPAIVGQDMKMYGPFKAEDVASLPAANAKILIKQGLGERIDINQKSI